MKKVTNLFIILVFFILAFFTTCFANPSETNSNEFSAPDLLTESGKQKRYRVPVKQFIYDPTPATTLRRIPLPDRFSMDPQTVTANFDITYVAQGGIDDSQKPCYDFPQNAKDIITAATNVWGNIIQSSVPITIRACWADLGNTSTLGYSGGGPLEKNFSGNTRANTLFSGALANALHGADLSVTQFDMHITFNKSYDWHFGTSASVPAGKIDFFSVVLHEIAHGLNFSGTMNNVSGVGSWGLHTGTPGIYDVFVENGVGQPLLTTYFNNTADLGTALTSNNLYFNGPHALSANGGVPVKIYAPYTWNPGSSYSHLDFNTFKDTSHKLMVYSIRAGEAIHDPGSITIGMLQDMGWAIGAVTDPDIIVTPPVASEQTLNPDELFTLSVKVKNQGVSTVHTSTIRYYSSFDTIIDSSDTEVTTNSISALAEGEEEDATSSMVAPSYPGIFYYGACVDPVPGETTTSNNCSAAIGVNVLDNSAPDLIAHPPTISDPAPRPGENITLSLTVENRGKSNADATLLRYYHSDNSSISASDDQIGADGVMALTPNKTTSKSHSFPAPTGFGIFYYGGCVDGVAGEAETGNNCSEGVMIAVSPPNTVDLVVNKISVSNTRIPPEEKLVLGATTLNQGEAQSEVTTLRYFRSRDKQITEDDLEIGTVTVPVLGEDAQESKNLVTITPVDEGIYFYGACVDTVGNEAIKQNNCSSGIEVKVSKQSFPWQLYLPKRMKK